MKQILILLILQVAITPGNGKRNGRAGNIEFEAGRYDQAITLYQSGIAGVQEEGPGSVHAGLLNNLGAARFIQGEFEQAGEAFTASIRMSGSKSDRVRASYNAGNAAAMAQQLETALEFYKQALLEDPSNQDAKFNFEFVKRQLDEQEQQEQQQDSGDEESEDQNEGDQNQQNQDENQDQENQQESPQDPQDSDSDQQQPQETPQEQNPEQLSEEEANRILEALQNEEKQLLREVQKMNTRPRRVEKDW